MSQVDHYDLHHSVNWLNLDHTRRGLETALSEIALLDYGILPREVTECTTIDSFKRQLKHHLFKEAYNI